jgi:predicted MPP superfamily phosphohydrolase
VVNELRADLVLLTGDLINDALTTLDEGIDLVRALDPRLGLYLIEGNHDLIENASEFERRVKASGIPFLLDESAIASVHGVPVQLLGLSWTRRHGANHARCCSNVVQTFSPFCWRITHTPSTRRLKPVCRSRYRDTPTEVS